ncbi:MAG: diguanylate cyclase domain-containing protein [Desulfovibrio sp.]|uniref:cache domain-containing protein n=1 Tax=Desulfovibrio sp. 7SRBS1 TaxID=3378064 RepID=UPI003B3FFDE5
MIPSKPNISEATFLPTMRLFLPLFLTSALILAGLFHLAYTWERNHTIQIYKVLEEDVLTHQHTIISSAFDVAVSDLLFLTKQNELLDLSRAETPEERQSAIKDIQYEYLALAQSRSIYDQIRLLGRDGMELVRVNSNARHPVVVEPADLQKKTTRYYFKDTIGLPKGRIYLSPLDLNVENGRIERPLKPMLRYASPVFNSKGKPSGIVVINYLAQKLLDRVAQAGIGTIGDHLMVNNDGYWLVHPDAAKKWGFIFKDRKNDSFAKKFPAEWKQIRKTSSGQLITDNGLFSYSTVFPLKEIEQILKALETPATEHQSVFKKDDGRYAWILVSHIPPNILNQLIRRHDLLLFLAAAGLLLLSGLSTFFISLYIVKRRLNREKLLNMAQYDSLTGLPNRTLFFDRLDMAMHTANRSESKFGLLYIDLDGFKSVNDTLGHQAGDELLQEVARRFQQNVRKADTMARLGGDEFAAVLPLIQGQEAVRNVGEKIRHSIDGPITLSQGTVHIGASIGAVLYPDHAQDREGLLHLADSTMYAAKKKKKNMVCLPDEC